MHRLVTITLTRQWNSHAFCSPLSLSMPGRSEHTSGELYALLLWVLGIFPPLSDTRGPHCLSVSLPADLWDGLLPWRGRCKAIFVLISTIAHQRAPASSPFQLREVLQPRPSSPGGARHRSHQAQLPEITLAGTPAASPLVCRALH